MIIEQLNKNNSTKISFFFLCGEISIKISYQQTLQIYN
jgi:hypothetical protein